MFYNLNVWIVRASLYSKVRAIFGVHLYGEKFVFSVTARYVVHMLKLQGHYASFDEFHTNFKHFICLCVHMSLRGHLTSKIFILFCIVYALYINCDDCSLYDDNW